MHPSDSMVSVAMIRVGCWLGRVVLDCTQCPWQDPPAESHEGQEARNLADMIARATNHVRTDHGLELRTFHAADQLGQPLNAESVDGDGGRRPSPPHRTCVDVSKINDRPGTAYVCGPACPCADEWKDNQDASVRAVDASEIEP